MLMTRGGGLKKTEFLENIFFKRKVILVNVSFNKK